MKWLRLINLYALAKKKRKKLLAIDLNEARTCICEINVTSKLSLIPMYKRPKEFVFLDLDIESRHIYNSLRSITKETKAIAFVIGHHVPSVDDAPSSSFDPLESKGYSIRQCIRELDNTHHEFGYMPPKEQCFTLVSDRDATKMGWRLVKDLHKEEGIDLDALDNDACAAMHFGPPRPSPSIPSATTTATTHTSFGATLAAIARVHILRLVENTYVQLSTTDNGAKLEYHVRRLSPETLSTLRESQRKAKITKNSNDITSIYVDKDSIGFDWLSSGWLAEKRITSGESYHWTEPRKDVVEKRDVIMSFRARAIARARARAKTAEIDVSPPEIEIGEIKKEEEELGAKEEEESLVEAN
ncbi:hypothetical protein LWI29_010433 [Acer saccharum]|uniref:Uncharacterized protein n=1 Tax=Acer saccharum TaxID=4024 RepID=A0AA39SM95_ACESA|nr:hypothetical protein LWI29_010433 [Acer saccharum]